MIDLHLHLDGSLTAADIVEFATYAGVTLPVSSPLVLRAMLRCGDTCRDLTEYLRCFDLPLRVLQTAEAMQKAVYRLVARLAKQGLVYAEIRFAPQLHVYLGLTQEAVICAAHKGLQEAEADFPEIRVQLILCCMRGKDTLENNLATVFYARKYLGKGVCAVDLAGDEGAFPTKNYAMVFSYANKLGVPFTIHAGEAAGAASIRAALDFGAMRIGHGVRLREDFDLMDRVIAEKIPLELCPSSNLMTNAVLSLDRYPLRYYMEKGVIVTLNTDNMSVSDTTIADEFMLLSVNQEERKTLLLNAAEAAFLPAEEKPDLKQKVLAAFA